MNKILAIFALSIIALLVACQPSDSAAAPISTLTPQPEPTPTWAQCQPFAQNFHDAALRSDLAIAELNDVVGRSAFTLELTYQPVVIDHAEAKLGLRYAEGTGAAQDANAVIVETLTDMPQGCQEYGDQWDALGAEMESPTFEQCSERSKVAREAIPEHTRWLYAEEAAAVLDKLADESSGVDTDVAYEVLGELIYADHRQMQEAAKASLISLCGATEWQQAAEELRDLSH